MNKNKSKILADLHRHTQHVHVHMYFRKNAATPQLTHGAVAPPPPLLPFMNLPHPTNPNFLTPSTFHSSSPHSSIQASLIQTRIRTSKSTGQSSNNAATRPLAAIWFGKGAF